MLVIREKRYSTKLQQAIYKSIKATDSGKRSLSKKILESKIVSRNKRLSKVRTPEQLDSVANKAREIWEKKNPIPSAMQQRRQAIGINNRVVTKEGWIQNGADVVAGSKRAAVGVAKGAEKLAYETGPTINKGVELAIQHPGLATGAVTGKVAMAYGDVVTPYTQAGLLGDHLINKIPGAKMGKIHARQAYQRSKIHKALEGWSILKRK